MKKLVILSLVFLVVASMLFASGKSEKKSETLIVSTWGLNEDNLWKDVFIPFEEQTGATIVIDTGDSQPRLTKLLSDPNASVDIVELAQRNTSEAVAAGLTDPIKPEEISCFDELIPAAQEVIKNGNGAPYTLNSVVILYDKNATGMEIKEWEDLWDPRLANKITIPDITTTFGPAMVEMAGFVGGKAPIEDNAETAFAKFQELKPNVLRTYTKSSDAVNLFNNGEIAVAVVGDFAIPVIMGAVQGLTSVVPESGTWVNFNVINISSNTTNRDLAVKYINHRMSSAVQSKTAVSLNEAPTNSKVELAPEVAATLTTGEVAAHAKAIDYIYVNEVMDDWVQRYNRIMNVR